MNLLLLKFEYVFEQAESFRETVLKIESDAISAFEVAHHLDVLKATISLRKAEKYIDPKTEEEINILKESVDFNEDAIWSVFDEFQGSH